MASPGKRERSEALSGLFAIDKPTGSISMKLLEQLKPLLSSSPRFANEAEEPPRKKRRYDKGKGKNADKVKLGQGGTLDPLATGVLVIGVNKGTKSLQSYLNGPKEYRAIGVLGAATDSLDAEGSITYTADWKHVTREAIEGVLDRFRGDIEQIPPAYSAIQIDGKRLYDYARSGTPLPRPVEARKCNVSALELEAFYAPGEHEYSFPTKRLDNEELKVHAKLIEMLSKTMPSEAHTASDEDKGKGGTAAFSLKMTVSGGTYVRTLVDDIARAVDSAAYVAKLQRTKQGPFELKDCVSWDVLDKADKEVKEGEELPAWEKAVMEHFVKV